MRNGYELFRIRGIAVRLHGSFLLLATVIVVLALPTSETAADVGARLLVPMMLFVVVVLHELGHALLATRLGIPIMDIMLTPLGGMARVQGSIDDGGKEAAIAAAGPAVNLAFAATATGVLAVLGRIEEVDARRMFLLEIDPGGLFAYDPLLIFLCFNLLLGTMNLIPAFPMDGGRIFRGLMARQRGMLLATRTATRLGLWFALGFILVPFFAEGDQWWILPIVGIYLIFAGTRERLVVEAREGLRGANPLFGAFARGGPASGFGGSPETSGPDPDPDRDVIDVTGHSRVVEDPDDRP